LKKELKSSDDLKIFLESNQYKSFINFIKQLQKTVTGITHDENKTEHSSAIVSNLKLLNYLHNLVDDVPPEKCQARFGSKSFKTYHDK